MLKLHINQYTVECDGETTIFYACQLTGIILSRFCFHPLLQISGNCRACLVEVQDIDRPVASCVTDVELDQIIWTESPMAIKSRENTMEILLVNHPLDCPICDQGGECDLQDQSKKFGGELSRFFLKKRSVVDKNCGFFIKTIMTRCIHCTRCVRFYSLINNQVLGILNRGTLSEIGNYFFKKKFSNIHGNVIDLCPVGALTSRIYSFQHRPWELKIIENLDLTDGLGSTVYISYKDFEIVRVSPKPNKHTNGNLLTDKVRFSYDSFTNNRLKRIYECDNNNYKSLTWISFLNKIKTFKNQKNIEILITEELDLMGLMLLKKLNNKYCNKIRINLLNTLNMYNNLYAYKSTNTLIDIEKENKICILFSLNLKLECALINFKLKIKYKKKILSIFCLGRFYFTSLKISFLSLNIKNIIYLLESKINIISLILVNNLFPIIFVGESFYKKFLNFQYLLFFFKLKITTIKIIKINLFSNEEGLLFLNIKNNIKKLSKIFLCVNLQDNINLRKFILLKKNTVLWINTHRPSFINKVKYLIPITTFLESETLFLNLEQKIQKNKKIFNSMYDERSFNLFILSIFWDITIKNIYSTNFFEFFFELIQFSTKFFLITDKIKMLQFNFLYLKNLVSSYPLKSSFNNYYPFTSMTKNSFFFQNYLSN